WLRVSQSSRICVKATAGADYSSILSGQCLDAARQIARSAQGAISLESSIALAFRYFDRPSNRIPADFVIRPKILDHSRSQTNSPAPENPQPVDKLRPQCGGCGRNLVPSHTRVPDESELPLTLDQYAGARPGLLRTY
ncbi:hypothetical protein, partial [Paraburkholderia sp. RL17-373-BIF-A]|uniref:hypothetical protein n=1 Tax=Paraburkholderia sp. RL17-373-BIF-A TaxID=3031629 RepID=UPI0038BC37ED